MFGFCYFQPVLAPKNGGCLHRMTCRADHLVSLHGLRKSGPSSVAEQQFPLVLPQASMLAQVTSSISLFWVSCKGCIQTCWTALRYAYIAFESCALQVWSHRQTSGTLQVEMESCLPVYLSASWPVEQYDYRSRLYYILTLLGCCLCFAIEA